MILTNILKNILKGPKTIKISSYQQIAFRVFLFLIHTFFQLYSDSIVGFAANRAAKLVAQYNSEPVYYYRFSYQGRYSHFYLPGSNNTTPYGKQIRFYFLNVNTLENVTKMYNFGLFQHALKRF